MRRKNKKQNKEFVLALSKHKVPRVKWVVFGLVIGVVLVTVGSVEALNGWFGGVEQR